MSGGVGYPLEADTQKSYLAVGQYIVEWNSVELSLQTLAVAVSGLPFQAVEVLLGSQSVPTNMNALIAIAEAKLGPDAKYHGIRDDAVNCANLLKEYSGFRNEVAHGRWIVNMSDPQNVAQSDGSSITVGRLVSTKSILQSKRMVTIENIHTEIQKLQRLYARVRDLVWRHQAIASPAYKLPSPWHGKF